MIVIVKSQIDASRQLASARSDRHRERRRERQAESVRRRCGIHAWPAATRPAGRQHRLVERHQARLSVQSSAQRTAPAGKDLLQQRAIGRHLAQIGDRRRPPRPRRRAVGLVVDQQHRVGPTASRSIWPSTACRRSSRRAAPRRASPGRTRRRSAGSASTARTSAAISARSAAPGRCRLRRDSAPAPPRARRPALRQALQQAVDEPAAAVAARLAERRGAAPAARPRRHARGRAARARPAPPGRRRRSQPGGAGGAPACRERQAELRRRRRPRCVDEPPAQYLDLGARAHRRRCAPERRSMPAVDQPYQLGSRRFLRSPAGHDQSLLRPGQAT